MNRYRQYGALDDVPEPVGDVVFKRLDMRADPSDLPPGSVQLSENERFDSQGAQVRAGVSLQFRAGTYIGPILYAGIYRPDRGNDRFAFVTAAALVLFNPADQTVTTYAFPAGETVGVGAPVDLIQAGVSSGTLPDLYIPRGFDKTALKFNGVTVAEDAAFEKIEFGLFYQDRIAGAASTQAVKVSDFLDFNVWTQLNQFQILKGGDDYLVGFLPWTEDVVIIGCRKRFFVAFFDPGTSTDGYSGGLKADTSMLRELTQEAGPVGRRAMKAAGGRIWFISDNAIYAFQPQLDQKLTPLGEPLSTDIQPIMERMSANHASGACIEQFGHRLYFALPISGVPVSVTAAEVTEFATIGVDLPFDLPALLAAGAIVTITAANHGLRVGDLVQHSGAVDPALNGTFTVLTTPDDSHYEIAADAAPGAVLGVLCRLQHVATRNNRIAVYNLNEQGWESIDTLPSGFFADWLRVADYGARRRLWIVDRDAGPALYEEADADVITSIAGGLSLPFDLPAEFSAANFATAPIPGRLKSRRFGWGAFAREVRAGAARLALAPADAGQVTLNVYAPDAATWSKTKTFDGVRHADRGRRVRCGKRGLEAELDIVTTSGRPIVRTLEAETTAAGRVTEN